MTPRYLRLHGDLRLQSGLTPFTEEPILSPPIGETLAIIYTDLGSLYKHGDAEFVRPEMARIAAAAKGLDMAMDYRMVEIPVASITDELLEEINKAIAISGYISILMRRLGTPAETGTEEETPPLGLSAPTSAQRLT